MNKFLAIGRNTKDVELRTTTNGTEVAQFSIAVQRNYKNSKGEYDTDFFNCVAYKGLAKTIHSYIKKGDKLGVEGRLQNRTYETQDGTKKHLTEVIVENIDFIANKKEISINEKTDSQILQEVMEEKDPFAEFGEEIALSDDELPF